jgi:hypothetical protein
MLFSAGCGRDADHRGQKDEIAVGRRYSPAVEAVLRAYSEAAWNELLPRLDSMDDREFQAAINKLAIKHLSPHKELLAQEGQRLLASLPKAGPIDRTQWKSLSRKRAADLPFLGKFLEQFGGEHDKTSAMAVRMWDPVMVARVWMRVSMSDLVGDRDEYRTKSILSSIVGWTNITAVDADPERPVIAFKFGPEMWLVTLKRAKQGGYLPAEAEFLSERPGLSTRPTQPSTLPGGSSEN